jgi:hypothetical protein
MPNFTLKDLPAALVAMVTALEASIVATGSKASAKRAAMLAEQIRASRDRRAELEADQAATAQRLEVETRRIAEQAETIRAQSTEIARLKAWLRNFDPDQAAELHMRALGFDVTKPIAK